MAGDRLRVTLKDTYQNVFLENSAILGEVITLLEGMREKHKDQAFTKDEDRLLEIAQRLLENNKKMGRLLEQSRDK